MLISAERTVDAVNCRAAPCHGIGCPLSWAWAGLRETMHGTDKVSSGGAHIPNRGEAGEDHAGCRRATRRRVSEPGTRGAASERLARRRRVCRAPLGRLDEAKRRTAVTRGRRGRRSRSYRSGDLPDIRTSGQSGLGPHRRKPRGTTSIFVEATSALHDAPCRDL